ncbi:hypothetical protein OC846_005163 [Tilletia horrida]|uniref:Extradiol ring-cleavage dioxygenase class III enzyme subunit B domain-containing protein n=1 Tax=Tilletia horrida TaxID=155126 RepID=A0AAN6GLF2_9BASI|nr:hypothetical protein OC846_005163 [Tilletia horrida]
MTVASANQTQSRAPVYFIAHGGPPTLFDTAHPAHKHWTRWGAEVQDQIKHDHIKGIVFVSAHWQAELGSSKNPHQVQINTDESNPLVYDYYNFPAHFYKLQFTSHNPRPFSDRVAHTLRTHGFDVEPTKRGLDHGVFIPLKAAFHNVLPPDSPHPKPVSSHDSGRDGLPSNIPLVQISLPSELIAGQAAAQASIDLGRALRSLRDQQIAIVLGGQPVHNLRSFMTTMRSGALPDPSTGLYRPEPFATAFSHALSEAILSSRSSSASSAGNDDDDDEQAAKLEKERDGKLLALLLRPEWKLAHPTDEHFLPLAVAVGASYPSDPVVEDTPVAEGGMAWNMYRFG